MATVGITRVHCNSGITLLAVSPVKPRRLPSPLCARPVPDPSSLSRMFQFPVSRSPAFPPWIFCPAESRSLAGPMFQRTNFVSCPKLDENGKNFSRCWRKLKCKRRQKGKVRTRGQRRDKWRCQSVLLNCPFSRANSINPLWPGLWSTGRIFFKFRF